MYPAFNNQPALPYNNFEQESSYSQDNPSSSSFGNPYLAQPEQNTIQPYFSPQPGNMPFSPMPQSPVPMYFGQPFLQMPQRFNQPSFNACQPPGQFQPGNAFFFQQTSRMPNGGFTQTTFFQQPAPGPRGNAPFGGGPFGGFPFSSDNTGPQCGSKMGGLPNGSGWGGSSSCSWSSQTNSFHAGNACPPNPCDPQDHFSLDDQGNGKCEIKGAGITLDFDKSNSSVTINDHGNKSQVWGDPHYVQNMGTPQQTSTDFTGNKTIDLSNGVKVQIITQPGNTNQGVSYTNTAIVTQNGKEVAVVSNIDEQNKDRQLSVQMN
jgi:hypothetical protein